MARVAPSIADRVSVSAVGERVKQRVGGSEDLARHELTKALCEEVLHAWGCWTRERELVDEGPLPPHFWLPRERLFWGQPFVRVGIGPPLPRGLQVRLLLSDEPGGCELHVFLYGDEVDRWMEPHHQPQLKPRTAKKARKATKKLKPPQAVKPLPTREWMNNRRKQLKEPGKIFGQAPGQSKPLRTKLAELLESEMTEDARVGGVVRALSYKRILNILYSDPELKILYR